MSEAIAGTGMTDTVRITITVPADVKALLERSGNASGFIADSVRKRWAKWTLALANVRRAEFSSQEIIAACEALNGSGLLAGGRSIALAVALQEAQRIHSVASARGVKVARWEKLCEEVRYNGPLADDLCIVVEEFWSGNDAIDKAIRSGGAT